MRWFLLFLALFLSGPARAELRALLVGVGDYTHLEADLRGPPNDVRLMAETLLARGADPVQVTALVSGPVELPAGVRRGLPTGAAIRAAMADLVQRAGPGDTVVFHFSGHGSQAPDRDGDEAGGSDEILLPMDAAGWNGAKGAVEGALIDDELQLWAQAVLDRGAQLVGVIDACHSDTGFRGTGAGVARVIDPAALGVPPVRASGGVGAGSAPLTGAFVFLYSAQSDQRAFEFPLGDPADRGQWYGAFTLALAGVLRDAPDASWAQVLAATRAAMTRGSVRQDPDGEGPLLEAGVFGTAPGVARFAVEQGRIRAGLLQGLARGAGVAFYAGAAGGAPLGTARLTRVTPAEAQPDAPPPPAARWAEVAEPAPPPPLRLADPVVLSGDDPAGWRAALAADRAAGGWTHAAPPDILPLIRGAELALAGADGVLDPDGPGSTPRVTPRPGETQAEALARMLEQVGHGLRLRQVLADLSGRGLTVGGPPIRLQITRREGRPAATGCAPAGPAQPFANEPVAPCDELWLLLTNGSGRAQDVTVLYQGRDFAVVPIWPVAGLSNRLAPGEATRVGLRVSAPDGGGGGVEDIWVLAVAAEPGAPRADLTRLATPQTLRGAADATGARIAALMEGIVTRGFTARRSPFSLIRQPLRLRAMADTD